MVLQKTDTELSDINLSNSYYMLKFSIRSEVTRKYYERRIRRFFDFIEFSPDKGIEERFNMFAAYARKDINWALNKIIAFLQFQKERTEKGDITAATLSNFVKPLKLYCEISDVKIPWKKIVRGLPRGREAANDRAPTSEEIRKLVEYPDRRIKPIVYTMASSGIRLGAFDFLQWKHIIPIIDDDKKLFAAKIIVYAGDIEEYYSFVTEEAYKSLKDWMDFRASYGEKITGDSWVFRDLWQTTNIKYGANFGLATHPKKLKSGGIKRIIERALWEQGLRKPLENGDKRHEWKAAHGFRKFFKTRAEQVMKPINVEIMMGHNIGLSGSYYKPTEREVLDDYLKASEILTINADKSKLESRINELTQKSKNNDYMMQKLWDKDFDIQQMKNEISLMKQEHKELFDLLKAPKKLFEILGSE
jgi:hypothetical protein